MSQIKVSETAKILGKNIVLSDIKTLAYSMGMTRDSVEKLCDETLIMYHEGNFSREQFCTRVLEDWINENGSSASVKTLTTILRKKNFFSAAGEVEEIHSDILPTSSANGSFEFGLTSPIHNFVGRKKELDLLFDWLTNSNQTNKNLVLISAIGGQGKSELCKHILQKLPLMFGIGMKTPVIKSWFAGENSKCLSKDISDFCKALFDISSYDANEQSISALIDNIPNEKLECFYKWVVVVDGVEEIYEELNIAVQALVKKKAFVIVTSRRTDLFKTESFLAIELQPLIKEEAMQFIRNSLSKINSFEYEISDFCKALQNFPLALQQAVEYIKFKQKTSKYGIYEYLKELNSDEWIKLFEFNNSKGPNPYQVIKGILDKLYDNKSKSVNALKLFQLLIFNSESTIERENVLQQHFSSLEPGKSFQESLKILEEFHLIKIKSKYLSISRLVQRIGLHHMRENCKWEETIDKLLQYFIENDTAEHFKYLENIWNFGASDSKWIANNFHNLLKMWEHIEKNMSNGLNNFKKKNLELMKIKLGSEHILTMKFEYYIIAKFEENMTRLEKLRSLHERQQQALGESHEDTLITASQINKYIQKLRIKTVDTFLGSGSFGYVFHSSQHNCAMKLTIIDETGKSKKELVEERKRLDREYNIIIEKTKTTGHPNLVKLYSFTEVKLDYEVFKKLVKIEMNDSAFILLSSYSSMIKRRGPVTSLCIEMELCGINLRDWLKSEPNNTLDLANMQIGIVVGIINGLQFLHKNSVIHRDLRPENIMFSFSSNKEYQLPVKIGDFGLCRKIHTEETKTNSYTRSPGNPSYSAPETETTQYGCQADLYSLGLVIWEVLQLIKFKDIGNKFYELKEIDEGELGTVIAKNLPIKGAAELIISLTRRRLRDRMKSIEEVLPYISTTGIKRCSEGHPKLS